MGVFAKVLAVVLLTLLFYLVYAIIKVNGDVKKSEKEEKDAKLN